MDFRLDDEQLALQDAVRGFCAARFPLEALAVREGRPIERSDWRGLGELGVLGVMTAEAGGGAGLGAVEAAIALEELGSHLVPGPVVWSILAAAWLPGVADGGRIVVRSRCARPRRRADPRRTCRGPRHPHAAAARGGLRLQPGHPAGARLDAGPRPADVDRPVPHAARGRPDRRRRRRRPAPVPAARCSPPPNSSACRRPVWRPPAPTRSSGSSSASRSVPSKRSSTCWPTCTCGRRLARSATYAAAALLDDDEAGDAEPAARTAKLLAGEAAIVNAKGAVQVLGGMGFSWAMIPHYLLKRAWVLEHAFGTADAHALALGTLIGEEVG